MIPQKVECKAKRPVPRETLVHILTHFSHALDGGIETLTNGEATREVIVLRSNGDGAEEYRVRIIDKPIGGGRPVDREYSLKELEAHNRMPVLPAEPQPEPEYEAEPRLDESIQLNSNYRLGHTGSYERRSVTTEVRDECMQLATVTSQELTPGGWHTVVGYNGVSGTRQLTGEKWARWIADSSKVSKVLRSESSGMYSNIPDQHMDMVKQVTEALDHKI